MLLIDFSLFSRSTFHETVPAHVSIALIASDNASLFKSVVLNVFSFSITDVAHLCTSGVAGVFTMQAVISLAERGVLIASAVRPPAFGLFWSISLYCAVARR